MPPTRPDLHWTDIHHTTRSRVGVFSRQIPGAVLDELVQEALLRTWCHADARSPRALAARIVRNLAIDWLRRNREVPEPPDRDARLADHGWTGRIEARLDVQRADSLLDAAPDGYRTLVHAVLAEVPVADLLPADLTGERRLRARDALYKRRRRSLAWLRARMDLAA